jgi:6-phosphogluconolactonase
VRLEVVEDPAQAAAERLAAARGHLALTGGSTPRAAYERLASLREDWSAVTLWFTDERCVPPDHEQSNYRMVKAALLDRIEVPEVHRMEAERGPHEGAEAYDRELRRTLGDGAARLDFVLLGLGPDAHVCSLFPNDPALGERERLAVGVDTPGMAPLVSRVTLTLPIVNNAREVVFLVTGEDKAGAVARAFSGRRDPVAPGSLVQPASGSLTLIADRAAAAGLEGKREALRE